jgi:hypothetical protein
MTTANPNPATNSGPTRDPTDDLLSAVDFGTTNVECAARRIECLLADLRRELHMALGTAAPWIDQKLPLDVRRPLEEIDNAVAELRGVVEAMTDMAGHEDDEDGDEPVVKLPDGRQVLRQLYDPAIHGPKEDEH